MLDLVTCLNRSPLIRWYVVRSGYKNGQQKDTCVKEIGIRVYNMSTILGSVVNMIGGSIWSIHSFNTFDFGKL